MRYSGRIRPLLGWIAVIAVSAGVLVIFPSLGVSADTLFGKAAAASAMLQLPEGGMAYLQNRFRDDLAQD